MEDKTKEKIKRIVGEYKRMFPGEYNLVIKQIKRNRDNQRTKFAEMKQTGIVERALIEIPETLNTMFRLRFTENEEEEFRTKKAMRWFAKEYPMFSLAEKI